MKRSNTCASFAAVLQALPALLCAVPAAAAVQFSVTNLGTLGGGSSTASGISASGQVVGSAYTSGNVDSHAFVAQAGAMQDLGTLGGSLSAAYAINSAGQVVGEAWLGGNAGGRAFVWQSGSMLSLGTLGGSSSIANGVNAAGQVVGTAATSGNTPHAFLWQGGTMLDLGTLGGSHSWAHGINAAGQVAGYALTGGNAAQHAFVWQAGRMQDLGTLGGSASYAFAINDNGQVVGGSSNGAAEHAFLWQGGSMRDLGTLGGPTSRALAINGAGQVVGHARTAANVAHAFLHGGAGGMIDLNSLLVAGSGAVVTDARAINDLGQIAATATIGGQGRAVLLTPVGSTTWLGTGDGASFDQGANWGLGFGPSRLLDAVITTQGGRTIHLGADAVVKSLSVGAAAGSSGRPHLMLRNGANLVAGGGVTIQATGTLSGDGTVSGNLHNLGTLLPGNLSVKQVFSNAGLVGGSGVLNATLNNSASGQVRSGAGEVLHLVGGNHSNQGLIDIGGGGTQHYIGRLVNRAGGRVVLNNATLRLDNGLSNAGEVQVGFGGATVYGAVTTRSGGKLIVSGLSQTAFYDTVDIESGGELRVSAGSHALFFGPVLQRGGAIFSGTGSKFYEGGLAVGASPGLGVDSGDVSFGAGNVYLAEIGGLGAGTQHDKYIVGGTLGFGGVLKLAWWNGFAGQAGQSFDLFDWGQSQGVFSAIDLSGASLAAGLSWDTSRLYSSGEIAIAAVPEPASVALWLAGLGVLGWASRRRAGAAGPVV